MPCAEIETQMFQLDLNHDPLSKNSPIQPAGLCSNCARGENNSCRSQKHDLIRSPGSCGQHVAEQVSH